MNGTNVDYYVAGFDADGKRVGSLICDFDPGKDKNTGKLASLTEKAKDLFEDAAVVDVISAADYNQYLTGEYVRGADGKPIPYVAPKPTPEELQAQALAELDAEYQSKFNELDEQIVKAAALKNETLQDELIAERAALAEEYTTKRGEL